MKLLPLRNLLRSFAIAAMMFATPLYALAQDIVITLKTNPLANAEPACVALQLGLNLLTDIGEGPVNSVTLFPTVDGVAIASESMRLSEDGVYPPLLNCLAPDPGNLNETIEVPLPEIVNAFSENPNTNIVICPLCWKDRYEGESPIYGNLGSGPEIHDLFLKADKVIDF